MAKTNPALHYSLFSWDNLDEFAHLDTLRKVIEIMPDDKPAAILEQLRSERSDIFVQKSGMSARLKRRQAVDCLLQARKK